MKTKSAILAVAAAVIGFAFVAPDASALPPSVTPGMLYTKKKHRKADTFHCATGTNKSIGLAVSRSGNGKGASKRFYRGFRKKR